MTMVDVWFGSFIDYRLQYDHSTNVNHTESVLSNQTDGQVSLFGVDGDG